MPKKVKNKNEYKQKYFNILIAIIIVITTLISIYIFSLKNIEPQQSTLKENSEKFSQIPNEIEITNEDNSKQIAITYTPKKSSNFVGFSLSFDNSWQYQKSTDTSKYLYSLLKDNISLSITQPLQIDDYYFSDTNIKKLPLEKRNSIINKSLHQLNTNIGTIRYFLSNSDIENSTKYSYIICLSKKNNNIYSSFPFGLINIESPKKLTSNDYKNIDNILKSIQLKNN